MQSTQELISLSRVHRGFVMQTSYVLSLLGSVIYASSYRNLLISTRPFCMASRYAFVSYISVSAWSDAPCPFHGSPTNQSDPIHRRTIRDV